MGAESDKIMARGGTSQVNPNPNRLFGGQWGAGGYYQPGTNTGGPSGSAPGDTPQFPSGGYNPPNQNGYGGGPQTGPLTQPNGPLTPVGSGPQIGGPNATGNPVSPSGPMTPVGQNPPANINLGGAFPPNFLQNIFGGLFGGSGIGPGKF